MKRRRLLLWGFAVLQLCRSAVVRFSGSAVLLLSRLCRGANCGSAVVRFYGSTALRFCGFCGSAVNRFCGLPVNQKDAARTANDATMSGKDASMSAKDTTLRAKDHERTRP